MKHLRNYMQFFFILSFDLSARQIGYLNNVDDWGYDLGVGTF